ncbi:PHP domain-containing protein [Gracilinema caldarium]|uniref:PHP domain-containing protein n=1 Tax=Gracilinema caldarium TaxID=215591 RepID=UPI0026EF6D73|nr:PHP domain-containing protein [Gracilinema caldarium]
MKANLHLHSRFSDGTDWPAEVAERAYRSGLQWIALTDHDTLGGIDELKRAAQTLGLKNTAAVEIDCSAPEIGYRSELLAYFPEGQYAHTQDLLASLTKYRLEYVRSAIKKAQRHFVKAHLSFDDLLNHKRQGRPELDAEALSFNKVDLFLYFKNHNILPQDISYRSFKKAYLETGLLSGTPYQKPSCADVIRKVHADGGIVVLPHIGHEFDDSAEQMRQEQKRLKEILDYFSSLGVDGLELYWYRNGDTAEINKMVATEAKKRSLRLSYGSDCHGPSSGKETLGLFWGEMKGL